MKTIEMKTDETSSMVHHPRHYNWKGIECDQIIKWMAAGLKRESYESDTKGDDK